MENQSLRKRQTILVDRRHGAPSDSGRIAKGLQNSSLHPPAHAPKEVMRQQRITSQNTAAASVSRTRSHLNSANRQISLSKGNRQSHISVHSIPEVIGRTSFLDSNNDGLLDPSLDPSSYVADVLSDATPEEIEQYAETLKNRVDRLVIEEQHALQQNYQTMLAVAHTANEMNPLCAQLRRQVGDLVNAIQALRLDVEFEKDHASLVGQGSLNRQMNTTTESIVANAIGHRQSIMMLNDNWAKDLADLFRRVEGAQKYIQNSPGRHVVLDSAGWHQLNSVTWQNDKAVTLFLLNDYLLVASSKSTKFSGNTSSTTRSLKYNQCWPLADLVLHTISSANRDRARDVGHAIGLSIPNQSDLLVYRAQNNNKLKQFVLEFQRAKDQLSLEINTTTKSRRQSTHRLNNFASASSIQVDNTPVQMRREGAQILAEIDLDIAYRRYEKAMLLCQQNRQTDIVAAGVERRLLLLKSILISQIEDVNSISLKNAIQIIKLLSEFGMASDARRIFLSCRAKVLEQRARSINFVGDIVTYVSQIAVTYFQFIKATVETYKNAFPEKQDASTVVTWTKSQVDMYASLFNRQLYKISPKTRIYKQCVSISRLESSQLQSLGIDMDFMLNYAWTED